MNKSWVFTAENELDNEIAVVESIVEGTIITVTVVTNEPAQYGVALPLDNITDDVIKESKNYMKDDEWRNTIKYVLLGEIGSTKNDSFYASVIVKWSNIDQKLVLSIKQVYSMKNNVAPAIGLGKIMCDLVTSGSSAKALDRLIAINNESYKNTRAWNRDLYRSKLECQRLKQQNKQLVEAKKDYDEVMMKKFVLLLNTKKSKISELSGEGSGGRGVKREREMEEEEEGEGEEKEKEEEEEEEEGGETGEEGEDGEGEGVDDEGINQPEVKSEPVNDNDFAYDNDNDTVMKTEPQSESNYPNVKVKIEPESFVEGYKTPDRSVNSDDETAGETDSD